MAVITKMALGGIADYAIADGVPVFAAPPEFDDAEAAAFLLPFQASHLALFRRGRLRAGQTVVVHWGDGVRMNGGFVEAVLGEGTGGRWI